MEHWSMPAKITFSTIVLSICAFIVRSWIKHRRMTKGWVTVIAEVVEIEYDNNESVNKLVVKYIYNNVEFVSSADVTFQGSYVLGWRTKVLIDPTDPQKSHTLI